MRHLQAYKSILDRGFVVVLTTNSHERKAVLGVMQAHRKLVTHQSSHRAYLGVAADRIVLVLDGDGAFAGAGAASRFLSDFIANERYPKPAAVVLCGVCWGNPKLTDIGDVLVGSSLISVNRSIASKSGSMEQPKAFETSMPEEVIRGFAGLGVIAPSIMLSVEKLYEETTARDELIAKFPSAHGGEMEGFAVVPSCENKSIPWLIIKAVSDFGDDDFNRTPQHNVSKKAAQTLLNGLPAIPIDSEHKEGLQSLADVLLGHSFELRKDLFSADESLTHQVNRALRGLESVIDFYTGSAAIDRFLASNLTVLLKELALNAFEHGKAKTVRVNVFPHGVTFNDDGDPYVIDNLTVEAKGRGGQLAWQKIKRDMLDSGKLVMKSKLHAKSKNGVQFEIHNPHPNLSETKAKCRAELDWMASPAIYVHPECIDIYIDIRRIEMMTIIFDTVEECQPLLDAGKRLYVALTDRDVLGKIEAAFTDEIASQALVILFDEDLSEKDPFANLPAATQLRPSIMPGLGLFAHLRSLLGK